MNTSSATISSDELRPDSFEPRRPARPGPESRKRSHGLRNYVFASITFFLLVFIGSVLSPRVLFDRVGYVTILFIICAGPFFLGSGNPRHRILALFMGCYFLIFGMASFVNALTGDVRNNLVLAALLRKTQGIGLTKSDGIVILGAICFLVGYFLTHNVTGRRTSRFLAYEWRYRTILLIGLAFWAVGFTYNVAYELGVSNYNLRATVLGLPLGLASNVRQLGPLGALMIVYLVTQGYSKKLVWLILLAIMALEFAFGFVASSKEISFRVPVLLGLGLYCVNGKVNVRLLLIMLLISIPYLLYFNAYRMNMMENWVKYANPGAALKDFDKGIAAVKRKTKGEEHLVASSLETLKQRIDGKIYIDIIVGGTDSGQVPYADGDTLWLFFTSFVPRAIWPEKPDTSTGQTFNRAFHLSESRFTYVPTTQLGDFYWNFGTFGVVVGMLAIGACFARLGAALCDEIGMTLPRFIVWLMAAYLLALWFSGNFANQYSLFVRLVIIIWIIDRFLRAGGYSRPRRVRQPERLVTA